MEFNETNWKECLEALNFTEGKNESFGGMLVYDDKGMPKFDYDSEERKRLLFIFLSGALYMKNHMIYGQEVNDYENDKRRIKREMVSIME